MSSSSKFDRCARCGKDKEYAVLWRRWNSDEKNICNACGCALNRMKKGAKGSNKKRKRSMTRKETHDEKRTMTKKEHILSTLALSKQKKTMDSEDIPEEPEEPLLNIGVILLEKINGNGSKILQGKKQVEQKEQELNKFKKDWEQKRKELEQKRKELEQKQKELEQKQKELEEQKQKELEQKQKEFDVAKCSLNQIKKEIKNDMSLYLKKY